MKGIYFNQATEQTWEGVSKPLPIDTAVANLTEVVYWSNQAESELRKPNPNIGYVVSCINKICFYYNEFVPDEVFAEKQQRDLQRGGAK